MKYLSEVEGKGGMLAKAVAYSYYDEGPEIITLELKYPRFIHSEFMTHRMFSRNASSSRAIPVYKTIQDVVDNPATPIHWGKNQPGMQADEQLENPLPAIQQWRFASKDIVKRVDCMNGLGVHKQVANRLLEPFQFINVVVTATEWRNFFELRLDSAAQPEIHELARIMKEAIDQAEPEELEKGDWHLPYVDLEREQHLSLEKMMKASVARCARVSYKNHDNTDTSIEKDIELFTKLLTSKHMSPFEHQATPIVGVEDSYGFESHEWWREPGVTHQDWTGKKWSGNFRGWIQYRHLIGG